MKIEEMAPWKIRNRYFYFAGVLLSIPPGSFVGVTFFAYAAGALGSLLGPAATLIGLIAGYCLSVWLFALAGATISNVASSFFSPEPALPDPERSNLPAVIFIFISPLIGAIFWLLITLVSNIDAAKMKKESKQWIRHYEEAAGDPDKTLMLQVGDMLKRNVAEANREKAETVNAKLKQWLEGTAEKDQAFYRKRMYLKTVLEHVNNDEHIDSAELDRLIEILDKEEITGDNLRSLYGKK